MGANGADSTVCNVFTTYYQQISTPFMVIIPLEEVDPGVHPCAPEWPENPSFWSRWRDALCLPLTPPTLLLTLPSTRHSPTGLKTLGPSRLWMDQLIGIQLAHLTIESSSHSFIDLEIRIRLDIEKK